jgi:hypothetical protein
MAHLRTDLKLSVRRVLLEELTPVDQLRTMANVDLLVTAHGGGEGWMVVMPVGSHIVEVAEWNRADVYKSFAEWVGGIGWSKVVVPASRPNASCVPAYDAGLDTSNWTALRATIETAVVACVGSGVNEPEAIPKRQ